LYDFVADQTNNFRDLDAEIIRAEHRFVKILRYLVKPRLDRIYAPIPPIPKPSDYISLPLRRVIVKTDGPVKYLPEEQDSTQTTLRAAFCLKWYLTLTLSTHPRLFRILLNTHTIRFVTI